MTRPVEFAQILLQCLGEQIAAGPFPIPDEKVCLRFGERVDPTLGTSEDECCTGLAWVRVASVDSLADPDGPGTGNCVNSARRITLEMGTARCIPFGTVGAGPSCAAWTDVALKMDSDQLAMESAICCATETFNALPYGPVSVPGDYLPEGPDGNCVKGVMTMIIDYDCGCPSVA